MCLFIHYLPQIPGFFQGFKISDANYSFLEWEVRSQENHYKTRRETWCFSSLSSAHLYLITLEQSWESSLGTARQHAKWGTHSCGVQTEGFFPRLFSKWRFVATKYCPAIQSFISKKNSGASVQALQKRVWTSHQSSISGSIKQSMRKGKAWESTMKTCRPVQKLEAECPSRLTAEGWG